MREGNGDMKYDPQKHHRHSIRLDGYDYSQAGAYFVTIVTHQRFCLFGEIVDGHMRLNNSGRIVQWEWQRLGQRFPHIQLGPFVVMPNHVHGVIVIRGDDVVVATRQGQKGYSSANDISPDEASTGNGGSPLRPGENGAGVRATRLGQNMVSSGMDVSPDEASTGNGGSPLRNGNGGSPVRDGDGGSPVRDGDVRATKCGPDPGSLGAIIGQLKSRVTKRIRSQPGMDGVLVWQRNYFEHIIRNAGDYQRVQDYVRSNPANWSDDVENLVT
jgi:putative transposase